VVCSRRNSFFTCKKSFFSCLLPSSIFLASNRQIYTSTSSIKCHTGDHLTCQKHRSTPISCLCLRHWQTHIHMTRLQFVLALGMVLIMGSAAGTQYVNGTGVGTCPPQYELILNYAACEAASTDVGYSFGGEEKTNRMYLLLRGSTRTCSLSLSIYT
jgi:hypothetical protein